MTRPLSAATVLLLGCSVALAADLRIQPGELKLTGPQARQRLLVVFEDAGMVVGDVTAMASFRIDDPKIATVEPNGVVRPLADGKTVLRATVAGRDAAILVQVEKATAPIDRSFTIHVLPALTRLGCNSGACHGALAGKGGLKLSLRGYDPPADHFVMTRQAGGRRIDRLDAARSLLVRKPTMDLPHAGGLKLDPDSEDYQLLVDWLAAGAPGPRAEAPKLERLEVYPSVALLKPGDTLSLRVRAYYDDGHAEDVTRWSKFSSSEDQVAGVNDHGEAKVAGHGEAALNVWFSNRVATCRVTSPLPNKVDPGVFETAERNNFIDDGVIRKLQLLRIPPSPPCPDETFIRRAYLDAAGILPTPEEVQAFVADQDPDKRTRLVDALLQRGEFIDYWAYRWSDLLLVSSLKLKQPQVWAFYQFVRRAVADNLPWDRFAREILTARGDSLENGAANYFVLHKDVAELTETTAITFLGTSLTCCRCHNHPLEKWTQDQYWSMANLFSRVALKNGDRAGEVSVQAQPYGDVPHPRRGIPMPPTPPDGKPLALDETRDRRAYFVEWLTGPENPYFARALVNRVWRNFMGRGLVEAEDDLRETNPPTNVELFDALAADFVAHKYDVKHLIRTIMTSAAYQRSSEPVPGNETDDRFYSHYPVRRLPAEVVLDGYAQVTGVPTPFEQVAVGTSGGTTKYDGYPLGTRALQLPDTQVVSRFLDVFGRPERGQTCACERQQDASVGQALHVNNGQTLNDKLRAKDSRITQWVSEAIGDKEATRRLFLLALSREPTADEQKRFETLLAEAASDGQTTRREALEDLFWAVLSGKEFLFNH